MNRKSYTTSAFEGVIMTTGCINEPANPGLHAPNASAQLLEILQHGSWSGEGETDLHAFLEL